MSNKNHTHLSVHGGTHGVEAHCDQMRRLATKFWDAATDGLGAAITMNGYLADPALAPAALIDPAGAAHFELALTEALDGPSGLLACKAVAAATDFALQAAADAYEAADEVETFAINDLRALANVPRALWHSGVDVVHHRYLQALQDPITDDPELADVLQQVPDVALAETCLTLTALGEDGEPVVHDLGTATDIPGTTVPRGVADLLRDTDARDHGPHGGIDVRFVTGPDGKRSVIVDITGTKSWIPRNGDITNLDTNLLSLDGIPTSYEKGVLDAMAAAGVRPDEPVMIVGHSQGGMVAVEAARDAVASGRFNVTHVVTAGAPIGRSVITLPKSVQVLALENDHDVVPHTDGLPNPDLANVTTVSGTPSLAANEQSIGHEHRLGDAYVQLAEAVDASQNDSVRDFLDSAKDFFSGTNVRTQTYAITRAL